MSTTSFSPKIYVLVIDFVAPLTERSLSTLDSGLVLWLALAHGRLVNVIQADGKSACTLGLAYLLFLEACCNVNKAGLAQWATWPQSPLFPQQTHQQLRTVSVPSWDQPSQPRSVDFIKITKCSIMPEECKGCYGGLHTWPQPLPLHTSMLLQWDFVRVGVCGAWAKPEAIVQPNCWHTE